MYLVPKSTEGGARTLVLAGLTTPAENGQYITYYQSDKDYEMYNVFKLNCLSSLTNIGI
jgi:hypothetical protein